MFLVLLSFIWLLGDWYEGRLIQDERSDVSGKLSLYAGSLVSVLSQHTAEVESLSVLVENSEEVTNEEFNHYVEQMEEGVRSVRLDSLDPQKLQAHLYPSTGADVKPDIDSLISSSAAVRDAVERTISSNEVTTIVTGDDGHLYLEEWLAIRKDEELLGLANITHDLDHILEEARIFPLIGGTNLVLRDGSREVIMGDSDMNSDPESQPVQVSGGNWQLSATPLGGWDEAIAMELTVFRISSLTIAFLITALVYLLVSRQSSLSRAVRTRTRELRESQQRYQQLFETSPDALFIIDSSGNITEANSIATRRYGYNLEEFRRMNILDLTITDKQDQIADNPAANVSSGGTFERLHVRRDGSILPVEINTRPIYIDGEKYSFGSVRDISERKQVEEALRASEEKFRTLFEESRDAVFICTPAGRYVDINTAGVELLGYDSRDEVISVDVAMDIFHDRSLRTEYEREMDTRGFVKDFEATLKRKDGKLITALISASAHREASGGGTTYRGIIRDVTEERRLGEQLVQAQKMESVGQLAGGIAHDFNNLLTAIQGYIDLSLAQVPVDSELFEDLTEARSVSDRAAELTRQMLLFSRREPARIETMNLNRIIEGLLNMLARLLGERYRITTSFDGDLHMVEADSSYIEQVIMNLVVNARDAMPQGGEIAIETRNVCLEEHFASKKNPEASAGDYVRLSVQDHGEGMDSQTMNSIFEPFFSTKGVDKGTGLGLSVVYGIIIQLGGVIDVASTPGDGSIFSIYLPAATAEAHGRDEREQNRDTVFGKSERILLVEDEDSVREIAERILTGHGYEVTIAPDADSAMATIDPDDGFDLVFSDVILPGEDGFSLARRLRKKRPDLKVLLTSGYMEEQQLREIREKNIPFLQKPYTRKDLLHMVRNALAA